MIAKISAFFQSLSINTTEPIDDLTVEMACTVLLCEVMKADGHLDIEEQKLLTTIIAEQFTLTQYEVAELIAHATELSEQATDFYQFTAKINSHFSPKEKGNIVTLLWQLANADGHVASIEEHIIRRIADLLHLSHAQYISSKESIR